MKVEFKDVLNLYVGCEAKVNEGVIITGGNEPTNRLCKIVQVDNNATCVLANDYWEFTFNASEIKPILRPFNDLTVEEMKLIGKITSPDESPSESDLIGAVEHIRKLGLDAIRFSELTPRQVFELTSFLLKRGFDLFGLIDSGQALDKTKMTELAK